MNKKFKIGQIVQLKSGGPEMTVSDLKVYAQPDHVECKWFGGRKLEKGHFHVDSLLEPSADDDKTK